MNHVDIVSIDNLPIVSCPLGLRRQPVFDESLSSLDAMSVRITDRHDIRELRELFSKTVRAIGNRCPLIPTTAATDNGHAGAIIRVLKTDGPSRPLGDARSGGKQS